MKYLSNLRAVKKFSRQEITDAKETLWRTAGESILGKIINRQGNSKSTSEINDISAAFKKLEEKDAVPMFLCTSGMVAQTPVYDQEPVNSDTEKLSVIDTSVKSIIQMLKSKDTQNADSADNAATTTIDTALGNTMSINDTENDTANNEWIKVRHRNGRVSQKWKDESRNDKHFNLVVSGFEKGTRSIQIVHYVENKDVDVIDCSLLTRREDATFLTFKVTVKRGDDADKIQDPQFWPEGVRTRLYKPPTFKKKTGDSKTDTAGSTSGTLSISSNTQPQGNNSGGSGEVLSNAGSIATPAPMAYLTPYGYPGIINANDWSRLQNGGVNIPQDVARFVSTANSGETGSPTDGVGRNLPQGSVLTQHPPAVSTVNARPFDMAQLNYGQLPHTLYVPSVGKQKQVRILDRLGTDNLSYQY